MCKSNPNVDAVMIWDTSSFSSYFNELNNFPFLRIQNLLKHPITLYQLCTQFERDNNLKYNDKVAISKYKPHDLTDEQFYGRLGLGDHESSILTIYDFYTPYPLDGFWGVCYSDFNDPGHLGTKILLSNLTQYRLKAIFNYPQQSTSVAYARDSLLIPATEKMLNNEHVLAVMIFINRINENQVSVEFHLFCTEQVEENVLDSILYSSDRQFLSVSKLLKEDSLYFYYSLYKEIYLNINVLSNSQALICSTCKEDNKLKDKIFSLTNVLIQLERKLGPKAPSLYTLYDNFSR